MADIQEVGGTLNALFDPTSNLLAGTLSIALAQAVETMEAASVATDGSTSAETTAMHVRLQSVVHHLGEAASELVAATHAKDALLGSWGVGLSAPGHVVNGSLPSFSGAAVHSRMPERAGSEVPLHGDGVALIKRHLVGVPAERAALNIDLVGIVEVRDIYMVGREGLVTAEITDTAGADQIADELQQTFPDLPPLGATADGKTAALLYESISDIPAPLVMGGLYYKVTDQDTTMTIEEFATALNEQYVRNSGRISTDMAAARMIANQFVARFNQAK